MLGHSRVAAADRRYRRIIIALAAVMAVLLSQVGLTLSARAANNPDIVISDLTLIRTTETGADRPGERLQVDDYARLDFTWDASNADLVSGDSFTVDLGSYFRNLEYPKTVPMTVLYNGQQVEIGTCSLTQTTVVCTFNSKVEELAAAGFSDFRGTGSAALRVLKSTTSETADITTNGVTSVDLPSTGGISEKIGEPYAPYEFSKWAGGAWGRRGMTWGINFGTKYVSDKAGITFDGSRQTIVITDTLGEGMSFGNPPSLKDWRLAYRASDGDTVMQNIGLATADGADVTLDYGDFDIDVEIEGNTATITLTGPFRPNSNYMVTYPAIFDGGSYNYGVIYENSATLKGAEQTREAERYFTDSFAITVEMQVGWGGFDVTKLVTGPGSSTVPEGTTFTVRVDYRLPALAVVYRARGWEPPGTLNEDTVTGSVDMTVTVGQKTPFNGIFPRGTLIWLYEDPSTSSFNDLGWADPVFQVNGYRRNNLSIGDRTSIPVTLTNTTAPRGTFSVVKNVSGADAGDKQFSFTYECSDDQSGTLTVLGDGNAVTADKQFPLGTTCTISENTVSAQLDGYTLAEPEAQTVTITDVNTPVTATFANTYTRDLGSFSVAKVVNGDYTPSAAETFAVSYSCDDEDQTSGTLSVPADGSALTVTDLPAGTSCAIEEDAASAQRDGYAVATSYSATSVVIAKDETRPVTVTNDYTRLVGGFTIAKTVDGDGAGLAPTSFDFDYSCTNAAGEPTVSGVLTVGAGSAQSVENVPVGTCVVSERDAQVANTQLATQLTVNGQVVDGSAATFEVTDGSAIAVEAANTYTLDRGTFSVVKSVSGTDAATSKQFFFTYECTDGQSGSVTVPGDGTAVTADKTFPIGTSCTVTEDAASAQIDDYSLEVPASQTVSISDKTTPVTVSFANDYRRLVGGFTVSKTVNGDGAALAPASFTFDYACVDAGGQETASGILEVDAGSSASVSDIPTGSCTITEREAGVENAQLTTSFAVDGQEVEGSSAAVQVTDNSNVAVSATNTYTLDRGSFAVKKTVTGDYTAGADESFAVNYTCDDADATSGTLSVPADGTAVSVDNLPVGTTCTVGEDADSAQRDGYAVAVNYSATNVQIEKDSPVEVTVTNEYTRLVGGFTIAKTVDGDGADRAPASFDFDYTCVDGAGAETVSGTLRVEKGSSASVADVPTGSCTITEKDAQVVYTQLATSLTVDGQSVDGSSVTVEVLDGSAIAIAATNTYTLDRGSFTVAKAVTGDYSPGAGESFTVGYTCDDPDASAGALTVPADGTPVAVDNLPAGTSCTITEDADSAQRDGYAVATSYSATNVVIAKDETRPLTVSNEYTRLVGGFTVAKTVDGDGADLAPASFDFDYVCVDGAGTETVSGTLSVAAGSAESVTDVPTGSCTVTEKDADVDKAQLATTLTVDGQPVDGNTATIEIGDGSAIAIAATNTYTRDRGSFTVAKAVTGDYTPGAGESFTVNYTCDDADASSGSLSVPADGSSVSVDGLPTGTTCTIAEDATSAQRDGYAVATSYSATAVTIEKDSAQAVTVTNEYTRLVGGFTIAKTVDGDGADLAPTSFDFEYACVDGAGTETVSGTLTVAAGQSGSVADIPVGTCTVKEKDASADRTQLKTTLLVDAQVVEGSETTIEIGDGSAIAISATNTYTLDRGSFTVAKAVTGDYTAGEGETFTVNYTCDDPDASAGALTVPADGSAVAVDNLPAGTSCTITEDADSAQRDGYALATSYSQTNVTIAKDTPQAVTVTNEYTRLVGGFTVAKTVDGDGASLAPQSFEFDYVCVDGAGTETVSGTLTVAVGSAESVTDVPTGSCTVTEKDADVDKAQLATTLTVDGQAVDGNTATIEIGDGSAIAIAATNTYTLDRGTFAVTKRVSGADKAKNKDFTFVYECSNGQSGSLQVPGDGTTVQSDKSFPLGTTCEVSEDTATAQLDGYKLTAPNAQNVSIEEKDQVVELEFTNTYVAKKPKSTLPFTGVEVLGTLALAVLAIAAGSAAVWLYRRRKES